MKHSAGARKITLERLDQLNKHGFDAAHDDYQNGELIEAAMFAMNEKVYWPRGWGIEFQMKILHKTWEQRLAVAGAFLAAEIDRMEVKPLLAEDNSVKARVLDSNRKRQDFEAMSNMDLKEIEEFLFTEGYFVVSEEKYDSLTKTKPVTITLSNTQQDEDTVEIIEELYAKHGFKLNEKLRELLG